MKISIFFKTFLVLLFSFSLLFLGSTFYFYNRFSNRYVEENIIAVKEAIMESVDEIELDFALSDTLLDEASSETQYIHVRNNVLIDTIGPNIIQEDEIVPFAISIYGSDDLIKEGNLSYIITEEDDINTISYIYRLGDSDYLLVLTRIQSLNNIDLVLSDVTIAQGIFFLVTTLLLSLFISFNLARPIRKLNRYAKSIASLDFSKKMRLNRRDELQELTSSLNEMAFNLQKTYTELRNANQQLKGDIDFEKQQEKKKKELIMTINHELKTPVSVIKGMVEGMIEGVGRFQKKEHYLKEVLKQLDKIEHMTKDLTYSLKLEDIARLNDECELESLNNTLDPIRELAKQKHIKLDMKLINSNVMINEELLSILVSNLLKNAILYSKDRIVTLETTSFEDKVSMEIRNVGEITEENLEKIFEPYYRINLDSDGTGLGLFIVKQICEIYGFEYKIYNDNGLVVSKIIMKANKMS